MEKIGKFCTQKNLSLAHVCTVAEVRLSKHPFWGEMVTFVDNTGGGRGGGGGGRALHRAWHFFCI